MSGRGGRSMAPANQGLTRVSPRLYRLVLTAGRLVALNGRPAVACLA